MDYLNTDELGEEYFELKESLDARYEELKENGCENQADQETFIALTIYKDGEDLSNFPEDSNLGKFHKLKEFAWDAGIDPNIPYNWDDIGPGIPVDDFTEYAQEFAYDVGAVTDDYSWPNSYIDWERAASDFAMDYNEVEYEGYSYYVRAI
jgi:hypothetical protein